MGHIVLVASLGLGRWCPLLEPRPESGYPLSFRNNGFHRIIQPVRALQSWDDNHPVTNSSSLSVFFASAVEYALDMESTPLECDTVRQTPFQLSILISVIQDKWCCVVRSNGLSRSNLMDWSDNWKSRGFRIYDWFSGWVSTIIRVCSCFTKILGVLILHATSIRRRVIVSRVHAMVPWWGDC
jgi:hypothetical protein